MTGVISYLIGLVEAGELGDNEQTLTNEFMLSLAASVSEAAILTVLGAMLWVVELFTSALTNMLPSFLVLEISLTPMSIATGYLGLIAVGTIMAMLGIYSRYGFRWVFDFIG